jgi:hypothetical protein
VRWPAIAVVLSGCHLAFGLERDDDTPLDAAPPEGLEIDAPVFVDRDGDGVNDSGDACIALPEDDNANDDTDAILNVDDPCPFNSTMTTNLDGDDLPDACDPFTSTGGDRHRCVMTFASTQLATDLWLPRPPEKSWAAVPGQLRAIPGVNEIATMIAATSLEGDNITTYQALFDFKPDKPGGLTLWLRANPDAPAQSDVGCHVEPSTTLGVMTVGVIGPNGFADKQMVVYPTAATSMRIQASLPTTGASVVVTCRFVIATSGVITSSAMVPLVPGRFGVTTDRWDTAINALYITDRM